MERILLVEDDAQITASLSAFLQSEGFSVETATGETRARQLVEQTAPGLLLVDVQLAEGSGFGVCAYARSRGLPVIFLTASGDESSVVLGLDMGADDYIAKPFRPRELVSRIRSVLRRYGKEKTLVPLGGVMVDGQCRCIRNDGSVIPGLYAGGDATSAMHIRGRLAVISELTWAVASAYTSGINAVDYIDSKRN